MGQRKDLKPPAGARLASNTWCPLLLPLSPLHPTCAATVAAAEGGGRLPGGLAYARTEGALAQVLNLQQDGAGSTAGIYCWSRLNDV
jgi:hypothetical protein